MKKRIYPHPFLLIVGSFYLFLFYAFPIWLIYMSIADYEKGEVILQILLCIFLALGAFGMGFMFHYHIFCRMLITDKYIKFYGFLLPTVKIKIEDVKYVDIRTFDKGNVCYEKYGNRSADSYKFILI